ncbi:MAG: hypothetical protein IBX63_03900 [Coriobacteriia bacterium]|nr:hypothetical protein [Coriobacteriia bacterium]
MSISSRAYRFIAVTVAGAAIVGVVAAASAYRSDTARAYAEEVKSDMASSYREASTWRAHVEERELVGNGVYRTTRHRMAVAGPDRYRIESIEQDEAGLDVVSVTMRNGTTVYSSTRTDDGRARVLEVRNAPPSLGAVADNMLGQRIRELARAGQMRYVGRDSVRGRAVLKLLVEPDHIAWVDGESSIPVREQFLSDGTLTHEIEFLLFEANAPVDAAEFDPVSLGAQPSVVEDLGFRSTGIRSVPHTLLGFTPRELEMPAGWELLESGYIDPVARADGAPDAPVWISQYATPVGPILLTQSPAHEGFVLSGVSGDGTDGPLMTEIGGRPVVYYADQWRTHATMHVDDVLVSVEGMLPADDVLASLALIR